MIGKVKFQTTNEVVAIPNTFAPFSSKVTTSLVDGARTSGPPHGHEPCGGHDVQKL